MNTGNHFEQTAARQTRRVRAGRPLPPEPLTAYSSKNHPEDGLDMATGWDFLAWAVVAVAATACAVILAFAIGFYA